MLATTLWLDASIPELGSQHSTLITFTMDARNEGFQQLKGKVKKYMKKSAMSDESRLFRVTEILKTPSLPPDQFRELNTMTVERKGSLDPDFIQAELKNPKGNNVLIYRRNKALLPDNEEKASGFAIYTVRLEGRRIVCKIIGLLSIDGRQKIANVLMGDNPALKLKSQKSVIKGCGDIILEDMDEYISNLLVAKHDQNTEVCEAEIVLESLNIEYVVSFYIKNGFVPDDCSELRNNVQDQEQDQDQHQGVVTMRKKITK